MEMNIFLHILVFIFFKLARATAVAYFYLVHSLDKILQRVKLQYIERHLLASL